VTTCKSASCEAHGSGAARQVDVAIIGGGLAGALLARQLQRTVPSLCIALFEKSTERSYKVGESLVEIASNHLLRRHHLTRYLYERHLPKNGLRYFFDDEEHGAALHEMSEIGPINLPFHPAFQIDRARMESDLLDMNRADGVHVHTGVRVEEIHLGERGEQHRFAVRDQHSGTPYKCRWLVDAAGRARILARLADLKVSEPEHHVGAVWGRFRNVADVDDLGPEEFRARVRHTSRRLSTIHFWYPGYWIWLIPLRDGVTSIGVVGEPARDRNIRTASGFASFLNEHRAVADLTAGAEMIDCGSYSRIAYGTRRFLHPDRWGLVGEAASSTDPFYSPGSDFIALENDYLTDLIRRDFAGEAAADLEQRLDLYERFLHFRHEAVMLLYRGLYGTVGSYELMHLKWDLDIGCYYNLWVSPYMRDEHLDTRFLRRQLRMQPFVLQALRNFAELFRKVEQNLLERGAFHRANRGHFSYGLKNIDFVERVGEPRSRREVLEATERLFNHVRQGALALLEEERPAETMPLQHFMADGHIL
jgi:flavin-dependent dehydrogenase